MHEDPNNIHALWDELTEFSFSGYGDALKHMLKAASTAPCARTATTSWRALQS